MRRLNPWVAVPALLAGAVAGLLGAIITEVSCRANSVVGEGCLGSAVLVGVASLVAGTFGMGVVMVLVYRSLLEWRETQQPEQGPNQPGR